MTVMQVIPNLGAGGAEQTCVDVTEALVKSGYRAIVVSNGGPRVTDIKRAGGEHIQLPVHSKNPLTMWRNITRLKDIIRAHHVDIVHARSRAPAWSCLKACESDKSVHFMTTCHAPFNIRDSRLKRFYNSSIARGELVIANSDFVGHYLVDNYGMDASKIRVIPRGIPVDKLTPARANPERMLRLSQEWRIPEVATIVMLPGRLTRWKGQGVLIEAIKNLNRKDVYCILLGDDQGRSEYRAELDQMIHDLKLEEQVRIASHCTDMASAYMLASVVVSASIEPEGFGRVAVEAQAMGCPVIATNIGGAKETVIDGITGWLIPPNDPQALATAIERTLTMTSDELAAMKDAALRNVHAHFTKEQMTFSTLEVYRELLQK